MPRPGPEKTALIVVDMQNGYLHPRGSFARLFSAPPSRPQAAPAGSTPIDLTLLRRSIPGCKRLVDAARGASVPIIYLTYVYRPDYRDGGVLINEINPALRSVGYVADGSWDAEIIEELAPRPEDFVIKKPRYSGFYATALEATLRSLGIETLVICGVTTHFCVECTARDAHMRDYRVFIAADATDEVIEAWKDVALASFSAGFGWVLTTEQIVQSWQ